MKTGEIAKAINADVKGDESLEVKGVASLADAGPGDISLYLGGRFKKDLEKTRARALVVPRGTDIEGFTLLEVDRPRLVFSDVIRLFHGDRKKKGIHPGATVDKTAVLGREIFAGANSFIGEKSIIGDGTEIHEGAVIYNDVVIGKNCRIYASVVVREGTRIGDNVIIHAGAVIGADGFGFEPDAGGIFRKIPQVGRVVIEDDVEIGANTCIDRAALGESRIGRRTKIDNLCQIGHGVKIGEDTVISGMTGISGSVTIGNHVIIGGDAGIADHVTIGDGARIAGKTGVSGNVPPGAIVAGFPHTDIRTWKKAVVSLYHSAKKDRKNPGDGK